MMRWLLLLPLLLVPGLAHADPITVFAFLEPALGAAAAGFAATVVSYGSYVLTAAVVAYGQIEGRRKARAAAAAARAAYNASLTDRTITVLQADPPERVVLGRARVGGAVLAMFTTDKQGTRTDGSTYTKPDGYKHLVVAIAAHQCRALHELTIDGVTVGLASLDGDGWCTTGEFASTATIHREVQIAAGGTHTAPAAPTVSACVQASYSGDGTAPDGTYTVSGNTITNTSAFTVAVAYTYTNAAGSVRVSWHLGEDDQVVDSYLYGLLPSKWGTNARLRGHTYAVITLDLEEQRFQGGIPGMVFDVSGAVVYDVRLNRANNPTLAGADVGVLPTGWANAGAGMTWSVLGAGMDEACGLPYVEMRLSGTATSTGSATVTLQTAALAPAAAAGSVWGGRIGVRVMGRTVVPGYVRAQLLRYDTGGAASNGGTGASVDLSSGATQLQWASVQGTAMPAGNAGAGLRLQVECTSGQTYNIRLRLLLPMLAPCTLGDDAADPLRCTDNPALCTAWFLRAAQGMGVAYDEVNDPALITAANACDVSISLTVGSETTTGPTYTCNGSFTTDESAESVLESLCTSMAGFATYGADWRIVAGSWTPPVMTLTDDHLAGQVSIVQAGAAMDTLYNSVRSQYLPLGATAPSEGIYSNSVYVTGDGRELWTDQQLDWTNHAARVKNLQRVLTERTRAGLVIQYPAKLHAWPLQVGDRVAITSAEYGWAAKTFQVTDWQFGLTAPVTLTLQEDSASIYDLADAATLDENPNTDLPNPWQVAKLTGLAANSGAAQLIILPDGTVQTRVRVTWTATTDPYVEQGGSIELQWRVIGRDAPNVWRTITLPGDAVGEYLLGARDGDKITIRATAINSQGVRAVGTLLTHTVIGKTALPANVTGLDASLIYGAVRITADRSTELDVVGLELRRGTSWAAGVPLVGSSPTRVQGYEYLWAWPAYGTYTVWAKYVDSGGRLSSAAASVAVVVNEAIKLGSDGIDVDLAGINLCPNSSFEIYTGTTGLADGWTEYTFGSGIGARTYTRPAGRLRGKAQRCAVAALPAATHAGLQRYVAVGTGAVQDCQVTAYYAATTGRTVRLLVQARAAGTVVNTYSNTATGAGLTYRRIAVPITGLDASVDELRLILTITDGDGSACNLYADDVLVEEATLPSAWHPSPLDELITTGGIESGAATEVVTTRTAYRSHTVDLDGYSSGTFYIYDCQNTWVNDLGESVLVEISASWSVTVNAVSTTGTPAVPASKLYCVLNNDAGSFVSVVGETNAEQPVPDIAAGTTVRWTCARTLVAEVPAGYQLASLIENSIHVNFGDGTTVVLRDGVVRLTVIKR
jgi:hypothetical protein